MKRFFIFFIVSIMAVFDAYALPKDKDFDAPAKKNDLNIITIKDKQIDGDTVTYSLLSGNDNACYVKKASKVGIESTFWFCGKKPNSAKCDSVSASAQDKVYEWMSGDTFTYELNTYYCCDGSSAKTGKFKKYASSEVFPKVSTEKNSVGGGTCEHTISTDACGNKTITKPCKVPTECPSGKVVHNNVCTNGCPSDQTWVSDTSNDCKCKDSNKTKNDKGACVVTCKKGEHLKEGTTDTCEKDDNGSSQNNGSTQNSGETTNNSKTQSGNTPSVETPVSYEFQSYDDDSCYIEKPKTGTGKANVWYCGKKSATDTCAFNAGSNYGQTSLMHNESFSYNGVTYRCCEGTTERPGFFSTRTEKEIQTKIKDVAGGKCEYTVEVDLCGFSFITDNCNTPDPKLDTKDGKTPVTKSNMKECGLCTAKADFKTCILNSCYEKDANENICTSKLKKNCSIKK